MFLRCLIWSPVYLLEPQLETAPLTFTGSSTIIIIIGLFVVLFLSLVIFISFGFNVTSEAPRLTSLVYVRQQQVLVGKASKSL